MTRRDTAQDFENALANIVGMATRLVQINMKARDDSALGGFWAEALGWGVSSEGPGVTNLEPEGFVYPDPVAVCLDLIASPEPKTVKNRVHVDLATTSAAHQAELVTRLKDLGATHADVGQGDVPWTVMADPEGNEFCVLDSLYQDTGPIATVVVDCAARAALTASSGSDLPCRRWSCRSARTASTTRTPAAAIWRAGPVP
jgi:Glyoxalase-like domain